MWAISRSVGLLLHIGLMVMVVYSQEKTTTAPVVCGKRVELLSAIAEIEAFETVWQRHSHDSNAPAFLELLESESSSWVLLSTDLTGTSCILGGDVAVNPIDTGIALSTKATLRKSDGNASI